MEFLAQYHLYACDASKLTRTCARAPERCLKVKRDGGYDEEVEAAISICLSI